MDEFIKDRDEAFASGDIAKVREYCKKYEIEIPKDASLKSLLLYK